VKRAIASLLEVSKVGLRIAVPLTMQRCTRLLSRLDGEVREPHVFLRSPNMREEKPELQNPTNNLGVG
jgi:hypothetical protein